MQGSSSPGMSLKNQITVPRLILTVDWPQVLYIWVCRSVLKWVQWKGLLSSSDKGALCLPNLVTLRLHLPRSSFFLKFIYAGRVGRSLKVVQMCLKHRHWVVEIALWKDPKSRKNLGEYKEQRECQYSWQKFFQAVLTWPINRNNKL